MLYNLLYPLSDYWSVLNVFQYITFRAAYALITSLVIWWLFGNYFISYLHSMQDKGQPIRSDGPESHLAKQGTPTMGGIFILAILSLSTLLWADLTSIYVCLALLLTLSYGVIGFYDDWLKLKHHSSDGLSGRKKLFGQTVVALLVGICLWYLDGGTVAVPFFKDPIVFTWWWYIPFVVLVIVGTSNAVNLTDGLDGLAAMPVFMAAAALGLLTYLAGHKTFATYLLIPSVPGAGELSVFCGALAGSCLGFLWYNCNPAALFMGDVGSLPLGGALGFLACAVHQQLLLLIIGGVFVFEALSVILQVGSYKLRNGKRIFRMAPIHHHFEKKGVNESQITVRFWIIALLLALFALSTLKVR
ncbi:MAG: phospho-N-acetylmuramoyl-pentapeptide-transferase [Mariprofundales bacterium]